jgi:hypothetical protein
MEQFLSTIKNKRSVIQIPSKRQHRGINVYDVTGFETGVNKRSGNLRATFYLGEVFIGLSLTDIVAFVGGDKYEYIVVMNRDGCAILKSWFIS